MIENLFTFVRTLGNQRIQGKKFFVTQVGLLGTVSDNSGSIGTAGKVLSSTGSGVSWITVGSGSSNVAVLDDLTDVVISTAVEGNLLRFNGTSWVNWVPNFVTGYGSLNDLSDVTLTTPVNGARLVYSSTTSQWINANPLAVNKIYYGTASGDAATTTVITNGTRLGVGSLAMPTNLTVGQVDITTGFVGDGSIHIGGVSDSEVYLLASKNKIQVGSQIVTFIPGEGEGDPGTTIITFTASDLNIQPLGGNAIFGGYTTATGYKTPTGTSAGFLKANGTVDTSAYITGVSYLNDIGDVVISTPASGEVLTFGSTGWINAPLPDYVSKVQHQVKAGVAITKGQAVYVTSADGTNMIVGLASNATEATSSKTMGLAVSTAAINDHIFIVTEGLIDGLDTSTATVGDPIWLGVNGNLIFGLANKPVAPAHLVYIGVVTRSNNRNGEIFVHIQNGFELNEIHDVLITGTITGQLIRRDGDGLWKNWTPNFLTENSVDVLTNKRINLSTSIGSITPVDSIDPFLGQTDIVLYQDGIDKGGRIDVDFEGLISISNPGIGYYYGPANTEGGTRFLVTVSGNTLTGTIAEFNEAITDGNLVTEAYVQSQIANLVDSAPATLDTLNELAAALGDDANFSTTVATSIGTKQNQLNGTGFVKASGTTISYDNSVYLTSETDPVFKLSPAYGIGLENITNWDTAYGWGDHSTFGYLTSLPAHSHTISEVTGLQDELDLKSPIASPTFTGTPAAPTAATSTNTTQIATTAFVKAQGYITSESDPFFTESAAYGITAENILSWDAAYGWGNHADYGYLTGLPAHNHDDRYYTETESDARFYLATNPSGYQTTSGTVAMIASGDISNLNAAWKEPGASIANGFVVYRYSSSASNQPVVADNANWLINIYSHPSEGEASYGHQLAAANGNDIYFRSVSNGTFSGWHKFWSTNDFSSATFDNWNAGYNNSITAASFATATGILTLTQQDLGTVTVNLDGRYLTSASDSQTLSYDPGANELTISNGNSITLDGLATETFVTSQGYIAAGSLVSEAAVWTGSTRFKSAGDISQAAGNHSLQIFSDVNNDAFMAFHISNDYAIHFGLDNTSNRLFVGGWSDGTGNKYQMWDSRDFSSTNISNWNTAYGWGNHSGLYLGINSKAADSDLIDGIDSSSILWGNARGTNDSVTTDADGLDKTGFYTSSGFVTRPEGVDNWMYIQHIKLYNNNSEYQKQIGYDTYDDSMWVRTKSGNIWSTWKPILTSENISSYALTSLPAHTHTIANVTGLQTALDGKASTSHNHDGDYVNVSGDTMSGNLSLRYSTANADDYSALMFAPDSNDYIIKASSSRGVFDRSSFGWHVDSASAFGIYSNGWVKLFGVEGDTGNTQVFGNLTVSGSITESSSIRYKKDVVGIESTSERVELLKPVRYKKIKNEVEEIGLIAEDVAQLFPEVVKYDNEGRPDGVNYSRLSVILLKAVQELTERVNKLENK